MEFQEVVRRRHMVREFAREPVAQESLDRILANAVRGPSAGFSQGQGFLVLTAGEDLKRFWEVAGLAAQESVADAPLVIVPMSSKRAYLDRYALPDKGWTDRDEARWPVPFWHIDTGMAALLILQTVVDEGLGALYFGIVPEQVQPFRRAFGGSCPNRYSRSAARSACPTITSPSAPSPSGAAPRARPATCGPAAARRPMWCTTATGSGGCRAVVHDRQRARP